MQIRPIVIPEFRVGSQYQEFVDGQPTEEVSITATEEFMGEQWITLTNGRRYHPDEFRQSLTSGREVGGKHVRHQKLAASGRTAKQGNLGAVGGAKSRPRRCPECESPVKGALTACEVCGASITRDQSKSSPGLPSPVKKAVRPVGRSSESTRESASRKRSAASTDQGEALERQARIVSYATKAAIAGVVVLLLGVIVRATRQVPKEGVQPAVVNWLTDTRQVVDVSDITRNSEAFFKELGARQASWNPPANPNGGGLVDQGWYSAGLYPADREAVLGRVNAVAKVQWKGTFRAVSVGGEVTIDVPGTSEIIARPISFQAAAGHLSRWAAVQPGTEVEFSGDFGVFLEIVQNFGEQQSIPTEFAVSELTLLNPPEPNPEWERPLQLNKEINAAIRTKIDPGKWDDDVLVYLCNPAAPVPKSLANDRIELLSVAATNAKMVLADWLRVRGRVPADAYVPGILTELRGEGVPPERIQLIADFMVALPQAEWETAIALVAKDVESRPSFKWMIREWTQSNWDGLRGLAANPEAKPVIREVFDENQWLQEQLLTLVGPELIPFDELLTLVKDGRNTAIELIPDVTPDERVEEVLVALEALIAKPENAPRDWEPTFEMLPALKATLHALQKLGPRLTRVPNWYHLYANHNTAVKIEYFKAHCTMVPLLMQRPEMQSPDVSVMILQSSWDGSSGEEAEQLKAAVHAYAEAVDPGLKKGLRTVVDRLYVQIENGFDTLEVTHILEYTGTAWMDFVMEDVKQLKVPDNSKLLQYFEQLVASPYFYQKEKAAEVIDLLKSVPPEPENKRRRRK